MSQRPPYPERKHPRLRDFDYASTGMYFVTICTQHRLPLFGQVVGEKAHLSAAGRMVEEVWAELGQRYEGVSTDEFVVMPNHVHGIVLLEDVPDRQEEVSKPAVGLAATGQPPVRLSLADVIHRFKSRTTVRYAKGVADQGWPRFPARLWQASYFERVLRNDEELLKARTYIVQNPQKWTLDRENPDRGA